MFDDKRILRDDRLRQTYEYHQMDDPRALGVEDKETVCSLNILMPEVT